MTSRTTRYEAAMATEPLETFLNEDASPESITYESKTSFLCRRRGKTTSCLRVQKEAAQLVQFLHDHGYVCTLTKTNNEVGMDYRPPHGSCGDGVSRKWTAFEPEGLPTPQPRLLTTLKKHLSFSRSSRPSLTLRVAHGSVGESKPNSITRLSHILSRDPRKKRKLWSFEKSKERQPHTYRKGRRRPLSTLSAPSPPSSPLLEPIEIRRRTLDLGWQDVRQDGDWKWKEVHRRSFIKTDDSLQGLSLSTSSMRPLFREQSLVQLLTTAPPPRTPSSLPSEDTLIVPPPEPVEMQDVRFLSLAHVHLTILPTVLAQHLVTLDLSYNQFKSFPEQLNHLWHLQYLDLSRNKLEHLTVITLPHLIHLDISHNRITELHLDTPHLQVLITSHNRLQRLPHSLSHCLHLKRLHVQHNDLVSLPSGLGKLSSLEQFTATWPDHNFTIEPSPSFPSLKLLPDFIERRLLQRFAHLVDQRLEQFHGTPRISRSRTPSHLTHTQPFPSLSALLEDHAHFKILSNVYTQIILTLQ